MSKESLGDRMKEYEKCFDYKLTKNQDYIIRIDGRHFHTLTKEYDRPFDAQFMAVMDMVAQLLLREVQGAKMVYVQSDEISIYLTDKTTEGEQMYFNNKLQKIVSVSASFATMHFNICQSARNRETGMFDSRIFMIPESEIANYFIWRQRDWNRNSLQMFARSLYTHEEVEGKDQKDMHEMLHTKGKNWNDLAAAVKNGRFFVLKDREIIEYNHKIEYNRFKDMLDNGEENE